MEEESSSRSGRVKLIRVDDVVDVKETPMGYVVVTKKGEILMDRREARKLYWEVKMRNRRKAFGL